MTTCVIFVTLNFETISLFLFAKRVPVENFLAHPYPPDLAYPYPPDLTYPYPPDLAYPYPTDLAHPYPTDLAYSYPTDLCIWPKVCAPTPTRLIAHTTLCPVSDIKVCVCIYACPL